MYRTLLSKKKLDFFTSFYKITNAVIFINELLQERKERECSFYGMLIGKERLVIFN